MKVMSGTMSLRVRLCALSFRKERADYYDYLADIMEATSGRKTLRDIFRSDAQRYGMGHRRGVLSSHWAGQHQEVGGDLFETFRGTLPVDDLILIRMAQRGGAGALEQTLRDVAGVSRLVEQARQTLIATISAGVLACLVMVATIASMPLFTAPRIRHVFGMVPPEFVGPLTRRFYAFSDFVQNQGPSLVLAAVLAAYVAAWSLPNLVGRARRTLDEWSIWRLYRDFQSLRFLASLATMVKKRGNVTTALRDALEMQMEGARPWQRWQVEKMIARIDDGRVGSETFDTGIVDRETLWFLDDLIATRGMDAALLQVRSRIETRSVQRVAGKAAVMRWTMLLSAVGVLLAIVFWHLGVVNEMRGAMTNYYSSR
jgi:type II secretory pathway component PulF